MRWWMKALIEGTLARVPGGHAAQQWLREHRGQLTDLSRCSTFDAAVWLCETASRLTGPLSDRLVVEFGTGWIPAVPVGFVLAGARVRTFDVSRLILLRNWQRCLIEQERHLPEFARVLQCSAEDCRHTLTKLREATDFADAMQRFGGEYLAPCDTRHLPVAAGSADVVISNLVLQCIPVEVLPAVLRESLRVLKPGGIAIHRVNLTDEYAIGDPQRHGLDFLSIPTATWDRYFNHSIKHLNRLRLAQFLELFADCGFTVLECTKATDPDAIPRLQQRGVAPEFRSLDWEELATLNFRVVLQKPVLVTNDRDPLEPSNRDVQLAT